MSEYIEVFTTISSKKRAFKIADSLLNLKLAACVQIGGPIKSLYWWKGKREKASEWILTIKTMSENIDGIEAYIKKNHPYEVPEIISREIAWGSGEYLEWIKKNARKRNERP